MESTYVPVATHAAAGRRRAESTSLVRSAVASMMRGEPARFDSWAGVVWMVVIALDFFWLSNPLVFSTFDESLHRALVTTGIGVLLTLPRLQLPRPAWSVVAVLAFGFASALWSIDAETTVDFTLIYLQIAVIGTVVAANAGARTVAQGITLGGVVVIATSLYALHQELPRADVPLGTNGYLAGVGTNRNILAYTLVVSLAFALSFLPRRWWGRLVWALGTGAVLLGIYLAQSGTGVFAALILLTAGAALAVADRRRAAGVVHSSRARWALRGVALGLVVAALAGAEVLGRLLGRDIGSLSGRLPLWEATWSATTGVDRWVGSGWGAVWPHPWHPAEPNTAYETIIELSGFPLSHGHNALFDLIPEIGVLGAAVFFLTYVQAVRIGFRMRDATRVSGARLTASRTTLLGVLGLVLFGLTEPMSTIPLGWFVIVILATGLIPDPASAPGSRRARRRDQGRSKITPA